MSLVFFENDYGLKVIEEILIYLDCDFGVEGEIDTFLDASCSASAEHFSKLGSGLKGNFYFNFFLFN
jgi:hypothetical protein